MEPIPSHLVRQYSLFIGSKGVPRPLHAHYQKWVRYYLDYCRKYAVGVDDKGSLPRFVEKLQQKNQGDEQRKQAIHAVSLFAELRLDLKQSRPSNFSQDSGKVVSQLLHNTLSVQGEGRTFQGDGPKFASGSAAQKPAAPPAQSALRLSGADWTAVFRELRNAVKMRHYSSSTLRTYEGWTRKFQAYAKSKDPSLVGVEDVKAFLSWLAVEKNVSASSQNQAFNALLFLFRHVLGKEFGKVDGVVRAKRRPYIPVVLSKDEVHRIIGCLDNPFRLIISLMYGCGLRISECLSLRVQNFNFDMKILTIHDGKGKKDRSLPLPDALMVALRDQLERVAELHERDCRAGFDGVFLYGLLEQKYKNAARELVWQWFFPARELTVVPETRERRRYHVHETALQKALRAAVRKARVPKRVSSHTFRHSYASHLLQANFDIRTIQELLGHSDVRTTMIYTHTVRSVTLKEARSPLDL